MSQDNKKKEYICPFCGCKMIVYESIESWLECSYCHFETQMHTCLGGAIAEFKATFNKSNFSIRIYILVKISFISP